MNAFKIGMALLLTGVAVLPVEANEIFYDTARVLSVAPQSESINTPRQECRTEYISDSNHNSGAHGVAGAVIGSIAGGLLGSRIGKGDGQIASAAIGAAVGAVVGDRIDNGGSHDSGYSTRPVERCTYVDNWHTVIRNYLVTYRYNGHDYTTTLDYDPGDNMRVRIAMEPVVGSRDVVGYIPDYMQDNNWHRSGGKHHERDNSW